MGTSAPPSHIPEVALLGLLHALSRLERQVATFSREHPSERDMLQFRLSLLEAVLSRLDICDDTLTAHATQTSS